MSDIGFTGSRWGMGDNRKPIVSYIVDKLRITRARHGMCSGADEEFHWIVRNLNKEIPIEGHPPLRQGSFFADVFCEVMHEPKDYLIRDKDIVDNADYMIATPETVEEKLRSGTWTTVRYAKKVIKSDKGKCKKLYIVNPNGRVDFFDYERLNK